MANELQDVLDAIKADKNKNLLPENIKKDIAILGRTGIYAGGDLPEGAHMLDMRATGLMDANAYVYTFNTEKYLIAGGKKDNATICYIFDKKTEKYALPPSDARADYDGAVWAIGDGFIYLGKKKILKYNANMELSETLYTSANNISRKYITNTQESEPYSAYRLENGTIWLGTTNNNGNKALFWNEEKQKLFEVDLTWLGTMYSIGFYGLTNGNIILLYGTKLIEYNFNTSTITTETLPASVYVNENIINTKLKTKLLLYSGSNVLYKNASDIWTSYSVGTGGEACIVEADTVYYLIGAYHNSGKVSMMDKNTLVITDLYNINDSIYTLDGVTVIKDKLYLPNKAIIIDKTGKIFDDSVNIPYCDWIKVNDNTAIAYANNIQETTYQKYNRCFSVNGSTLKKENGAFSVTDRARYKFSHSVKMNDRFYLLYNKYRNNYTADNNGADGNMPVIYDAINNTVNNCTYYGIQGVPSMSGNFAEFDIDVYTKHGKWYYAAVPSVHGMSYGRIILPRFEIRVTDTDYEVALCVVYGGAPLGGEFYYTGPNLLCDSDSFMQLDVWADISESADYWNNHRCATNQGQILYGV